MALKPIPQAQVQQTAQILLAFLDSDGANVPGSMLEGVVSSKSLLRGFLTGNLVVCAEEVPQDPPTPLPQKTAKKEVTKKKAAKNAT